MALASLALDRVLGNVIGQQHSHRSRRIFAVPTAWLSKPLEQQKVWSGHAVNGAFGAAQSPLVCVAVGHEQYNSLDLRLVSAIGHAQNPGLFVVGLLLVTLAFFVVTASRRFCGRWLASSGGLADGGRALRCCPLWRAIVGIVISAFCRERAACGK